MATIDFRELRRRERQRVRSSTNKADSSCVKTKIDITSSVAVNDESQPQKQNVRALAPFETLLPQHMLSEEIHQIQSANIDSVFYAEQFLPPKVLEEIMAWLQTIPDYLQTGAASRANNNGMTEEEMSLQHNGKWTRLKHARRKVALFDGTISSYELPPILQRMSNTLVSIGAFSSSNPPNHVLINEYQPGEGIMPHTDGPAYESCTATISLGGSDVIFKLRPRQHYARDCDRTLNNQQKLDMILHGNGSIIVFRDDAYLEHTHEITEGVLEESTEKDICGNDLNGGTIVKRGYRISLTFRSKKVKKGQ